MHGARAGALDIACTDARAGDLTTGPDARGALGCVAARPLAIRTADHAARRGVSTAQETIRATGLRALAAEIVTVRRAAVAAHRAAAVHAEASLIAVVPGAIEEALVAPAALATVARAAAAA